MASDAEQPEPRVAMLRDAEADECERALQAALAAGLEQSPVSEVAR